MRDQTGSELLSGENNTTRCSCRRKKKKIGGLTAGGVAGRGVLEQPHPHAPWDWLPTAAVYGICLHECVTLCM